MSRQVSALFCFGSLIFLWFIGYPSQFWVLLKRVWGLTMPENLILFRWNYSCTLGCWFCFLSLNFMCFAWDLVVFSFLVYWCSLTLSIEFCYLSSLSCFIRGLINQLVILGGIPLSFFDVFLFCLVYSRCSFFSVLSLLTDIYVLFCAVNVWQVFLLFYSFLHCWLVVFCLLNVYLEWRPFWVILLLLFWVGLM